MREFPGLVELHDKRSDSVACISLSFDYEGSGKPEDFKEKILDFLRRQGAVFDNVISSVESDVLYEKLNISGAVPTVLVYDRQGKQVKQFNNDNATSTAEFFTYEQIGSYVDGLLAKP